MTEGVKKMDVNPIKLEIFNQLLSSVAEEMGEFLARTALSPNIKERKDFSCAIFTRDGELIAQAAHIPVHLGSMPLSVKNALATFDSIDEGDIIILNDPYRGGTHLPDITLIKPLFYEGKLKFFLANRAHHADVGGISPGSMPLAGEIYQEGVIIPPIKIYRAGKKNGDILNLIFANMRNPQERMGDIQAQIATLNYGADRLTKLIRKYGEDTTDHYVRALIDYTAAFVKKLIEEIPEGKEYHFTDYLDDDGIDDTPVKISVTIRRIDTKLIVDFSPSSPQRKGSINTVKAVTVSSVLYVLRSLLQGDPPTNEGLLKNIEIRTRPGSVVDALPPAAVSGGNVETSQRIVDVLLGAFSEIFPHKIPAASQGTMNNLTFGNSNYTFYETIGGGMGAHPAGDGESAIHSHMTNTLNTPIEAMELNYPVRVWTYRIRENSGGNGMHRGGDGIIREIEFLEEMKVTMISERRKRSPYGLNGGGNGATGRNIIIREGREEIMPGKFSINVSGGTRLRIETPGGGGYGETGDIET